MSFFEAEEWTRGNIKRRGDWRMKLGRKGHKQGSRETKKGP
jgi:hypothetical protein